MATKRTSAESSLPRVDPNAPGYRAFANPFRTYPLSDDFKGSSSYSRRETSICYIFNTGHFREREDSQELTLNILENIVEGKAGSEMGTFRRAGDNGTGRLHSGCQRRSYMKLLRDRLVDRFNFIRETVKAKGVASIDCPEAIEVFAKLIERLR